MRVLFSIRSPANVRQYEGVLRQLAARGHEIQLVKEPFGTKWPPFVRHLVESCPSIRLGTLPPMKQDEWWEVATQFRAENPESDLLIEGHCDERGTEGYNMALGERRALSIRELLVSLGVPSERVHTVSFGKDRPADPGHNEAAWSKNRRAEFILVLPRK